MTADELTARLAEALGWAQPDTSRAGWADHLAAALLPVVEELRREAAADELEITANHDRMPLNGRRICERRAVALRARR
jgi:hypothetical protein